MKTEEDSTISVSNVLQFNCHSTGLAWHGDGAVLVLCHADWIESVLVPYGRITA